MMAFSAVPWQPELKKESEKVGSLLWIIHIHRGSAANLMVGYLWNQGWYKARPTHCSGLRKLGQWLPGCKDISVGCPHPGHPLPHPSMLSKRNLVKMKSLGHQRNRGNRSHRGTIWSLRRGQCGVREVTPPSIALVMGARKENEVSAFSYHRKGNSPSQSTGEISLGNHAGLNSLNCWKDKDTGEGVPGTLEGGTVGGTSSAGRDLNKYTSSVVCFSVERKNTHPLLHNKRFGLCLSWTSSQTTTGSRQTPQITLDLGSWPLEMHSTSRSEKIKPKPTTSLKSGLFLLFSSL